MSRKIGGIAEGFHLLKDGETWCAVGPASQKTCPLRRLETARTARHHKMFIKSLVKSTDSPLLAEMSVANEGVS
jgi:hypothetical protein